MMKPGPGTLGKMLAAFLVAWGGLALAGSLLWPMGFDQGTYAWVGDLILRGGVLYRDAWEVKGPATYYTYALCQWIFGRHLYGIRLCDALLLLAAAASLWRLLAQRHAARWAGLGALLFIFYYLKGGYWNTATSDGYGTMLLMMALPLMVGRGRGAGALTRTAAAGGLAGLAVMFKITFLPLLAPLALLIVSQSATGRGRRGAALAVFLLAAGVMTGAWVEYLRLRGGWGAFVEINRFLKDLYRTLKHRTVAGHLAALAEGLGAAWALAILWAIGLRARWRRDRAFTLCGLVWLATGVALLVYQNKYYPYQFLIILPPLVWGAGPGLLRLRAWCRARRRGPRAYRAVLAIALALALPPLNVPALLALAREHRLGATYYGKFAAHVNESCETTRRVAEYLRTHSRPEDTIQVWGWDNLLYTLGERACATRFGFIYPLAQAVRGSRAQRLIDSYRASFLDGLRRARPKFIVIADHDLNSLTRATSREVLERRSNRPILEYIKSNYVWRISIGHYGIWERQAGAGQ